MIWGKRKKANGTTNRRNVSGKLGRALLAILLAATLVPAIPHAADPLPAYAEEDGGFASTTDYTKVFNIENIVGKPVSIDGATLRVATTVGHSATTPMYEIDPDGTAWSSTGAFATKTEVSLLHDWEIHATPTASSIVPHSRSTHIIAVYGLGLSSNPDPLKQSGYSWRYQRIWNESSPANTSLEIYHTENGSFVESLEPVVAANWSNEDIRFYYNSKTGTLSLEAGGSTLANNIKSLMRRDSAYLFLSGSLYWQSKDGLATANAPQGTLQLTFDSMSIPHLNPQISSIKLYRLNQTSGLFDILVEPDDELEPDEVVRAVCTVSNANASSAASGYSERFNMHLKLADTEAYPTRGIAPFADAAHPLQVDGKTVATAPGDNTLTGANWVPLALVGTTPVEVSYYAKVNQGSAAVSVSHELIEDSFQGSQFKTVELLPKRALVPGDPGDPTLKPGTDYHYTRLPAANENGWNGIASSPVDVTFYAGDFDRFTVSSTDGSALSTLAGGQKWTQSADVDALPVTYQATNTASGALSTTDEDTLRIDTQAPSLTYDAATGALTADDTGAADKATSGIWKIERVKADGRALGTEDITPQSHAAAAYADEQTRWDFLLTDGKGSATQTVAGAQPGFYVATDAAGNRSAVFEVKEPETPVDPGPDTPTPPVDPTPDDPNKPGSGDPSDNNPGADKPVAPTVTPKPSGDGDDPAPKPLAPTVTDKDPATGLQHDTVEHALTLPTAPGSITPAMMSQLIADRYAVTANRPDGAITAGPVSLFDAAGNPVAAIDRTRPGTWVAEQTFTDSAGNSTTIRLAVTVKENTISGTISSEGDGTADSSGSAGSGSGTNGSNGTGTGNALLTRLTDLPQTGGLIGPCPLHILFLLMIFAVSAYSVLRLTDEPRRRNSDAYRNDEALRARRYTVFDGLVHGVVALCAVALALRPFCLYDLLWAAATVVVVLFWSALFLHRSRSAKRAAVR